MQIIYPLLARDLTPGELFVSDSHPNVVLRSMGRRSRDSESFTAEVEFDKEQSLDLGEVVNLLDVEPVRRALPAEDGYRLV